MPVLTYHTPWIPHPRNALSNILSTAMASVFPITILKAQFRFRSLLAVLFFKPRVPLSVYDRSPSLLSYSLALKTGIQTN